VGKTDLSLKIAREFNGEIISADSRQFFRELNIGTAKPSEDELNQVPHHFINSHSIQDDYTAGKFEKDGLDAIEEILNRNKLPIIVGGSGFYIQALIDGLDQPPSDPELRAALEEKLEKEGLEALCDLLKEIDPEKHQSIDLSNPRRLVRAIEIAELKKRGLLKEPVLPKKRDFDSTTIVLNRNRQELYDRINTRVDKMMEAGLLAEVEQVVQHKEAQAMQTVGYKELVAYLEGELELDKAISLIKQNTRRYAKRQITWFKRIENAHWFRPEDENTLQSFVKEWLNEGV
jgi:tRNA dimethylallyltransferase